MDHYWASKRLLFTRYLRKSGRGTAVVHTGDPRGRELAKSLPVPVWTVGDAPRCRLRPRRVRFSPEGIAGELLLPGGPLPFASRLVGRHNLENILCAAGAAAALGLSEEALCRGIDRLHAVPGRLEPVANDTGRFVFVDYAHTPDALAHAVGALREVIPGRLICVFGCGGDRDRTKRPHMGRIAARGADLAVVTSDNPRSEKPEDIIADILPGVGEAGTRRFRRADLKEGFGERGWTVEPNRAAAIALAVTASRAGDTLLIAGKGHETYQVLADRTIDFDDRRVAATALADLSPEGKRTP
jgi:UDP-N-acetylmuramyl-tripeptide synthetase